MDGVSALRFDNVAPGDYFVVVRHRNHLAVITSGMRTLNKTVDSIIDFTLQGSAFGTDALHIFPNGSTALINGDANGDGSINATDRSITWNTRNQIGYLEGDCNMDGGVNASDRSITWNNRNTATWVP